MDARRFEGRTAIVTGAGSGIGLATATRLVREGARVVVTDLRADRVESAVAALDALGGATPIGVTGDISVQETVDAVVAAAGERVDVLVNNAGIMDNFVPTAELTDAQWEQVFAVNVTAVMRTMRAVLPLMAQAGAGAIVNVGSEASLRAGAAGAAYTASKHAVLGLTRSTALMYRADGVRCNAVLPGAVATNIEVTAPSRKGMSVMGPYLATIPGAAEADQLAAAICWLASDDSANVTGVGLPSDGGWSAI
ncbi:SDR family NAD(P)-dependent oxidoreductase [Georgenia yuyongxinii]